MYEMPDVLERPSGEVVNYRHAITTTEEVLCEVGSDESGPARD